MARNSSSFKTTDIADGNFSRRQSELCPQSIKLSAVCNSKMQTGTESVICPDFETRAAREGTIYGEGRGGSNRAAKKGARGDRPPAPSQRLTKKNAWNDRDDASSCRTCNSSSAAMRPASPQGITFHMILVPTGILGRDSLHLTNLGAGDGQGGLTCLSFRCLSSYLIFSASSSHQQAAGRISPEKWQASARTDLCAVSHLTTNELEERGLCGKLMGLHRRSA